MIGGDGATGLLDQLARLIARHVVDELRAGSSPDWVDQASSPLGARKHCAAIRSGKLPGARVGRRWLARREDVDRYLTEPRPRKPRKASAVDELAAQIGIEVKRTG